MRIRKHSKISTLFLSSSSSLSSNSLLHSHICLLNQSPWDVIDFSPSDSPPPPPFQSQQLDADNSFNGDVTLVESIVGLESVDSMKLGNLCSKNDGKQWQCSRATHKNESSSVSNKPVRARKSRMNSSSNPNDYYYYSRFGPRWGKKRNTIVNSSEVDEAEKVTAVSPCYSSTEIDDIVNDDDDDDDDYYEEDRMDGIKRRRKPIKARSLKDLCC